MSLGPPTHPVARDDSTAARGAPTAGPGKRSFLCVDDLDPGVLSALLDSALEMKRAKVLTEALRGYTVALLFQKTSTRTRCSFEAGVIELGGHPMYIDWSRSNFVLADLKDEIRALSRYARAIVARVNTHDDLEVMRDFSEVPVINGLSDFEHPCQALADFMTIREHFDDLRRVRIAYVGDGNNVCNSLIRLAWLLGASVTLCHPRGYGPHSAYVADLAKSGRLRLVERPADGVSDADVVYTDTWVSMGSESEQEERLRVFAPYQINAAVMDRAPRHCLFMHCLPAHRGQEVTGEVLDSPRSVIFDQAENRKHAQKALLKHLCPRL